MNEEYNAYETRKDQAIVDCLRLLDSHLDGMESTHTVGELYNLCLAVRERLAPNESIAVEAEEKSEEALAEKTVKNICDTLDAISYVTSPGNKDKIENEMKQYPCAKCIHCIDGGCNIGAGFECLREPEKYWKAEEE